MISPDVASLLRRTEEILVRLGFKDDKYCYSIGKFLSGPIVLAIIGNRSRERATLVEKLHELLPAIQFRSDLAEDNPENELVDAIVVTTPCDAALSLKEIEIIRACRLLKRPILVIVTDIAQLGKNYLEAKKEIEALRLKPYLESEQVKWYFSENGTNISSEVSLINELLSSDPIKLHEKPSLDLLKIILDRTENAFNDRCNSRDHEFSLLRHIEAQGSLDLAELSEWEKVERLRAGDRVRSAFDKVLIAAEGTGDALSSWARSGAHGDGKDATSAIEEAWSLFSTEIKEVANDSIRRMQEEFQRLMIRAQDTANKISVDIAHENILPPSFNVPSLIQEAAHDIADTSIIDLIEAAVEIAQLSVPKKNDLNDKKKSFHLIPNSMQSTLPQPLTPAERIRGHLVQGIRSRIDIRLKSYVERLENTFKEQTIPRLQGFELSRNKIVNQMRTTLNERYSWSTALGELQILTQDIEDYRRLL